MSNIRELAADIMDLYYKDFADSNDNRFFDLDYFIRHTQDSYVSILQSEFLNMYSELKKESLDKVQNVTFSEQFLYKETVKIKNNQIELSYPIMGFRYDRSASGVQDIQSKCAQFIKIRYDQLWHFRHIASYNHIYYWVTPEKNETRTIHLFKKCGCDEADVYYIPMPKEDMKINKSFADDIKKHVLQLMWQSTKEGIEIEEVNDSSRDKEK